MVVSGRTHVWPLNVAAPDLRALAPHDLVQPVQQHQQPVEQPQQQQDQSYRPRPPLEWFRLLSLPLELVFAILSFLEPPDLLALSCTCRTFANLLRRSGDRRALKLWTQARRNMDVPELKSDLRAGGDDVAAEVLLARLIGGETCQVCGGEARHADLDARTRVCLTCASSLFMSPEQLSHAHSHLHARTFDCAFKTWDEDDPSGPTQLEYFVPDALAISARLTSITAQALGAGTSPETALSSYISNRRVLCEHVRYDAWVLQYWLDRRAERAAEEKRQRVARRLKQVSDKLEAHGFAKCNDEDLLQDFGEYGYEPPVWCEGAAERQERERRNNELEEFCTTDEPLDDDEWDVHKDRFVAWVGQDRRDRRERMKNYEHNWQRRALKPLYEDLQHYVNEEALGFFLPLPSFLRLPSLRAEWAYVGPLRIETYSDKFRRLLPCAIADAVEAARNDRLVLLDRLARTLLAEGDPLPASILFALSSSPSPFIDRDPRFGVEPAYTAISPADADALFERAVALFRCGVCGLVAPFAQIVPHVHASHSVRAPPRCLVAPAQVRELVRAAAGPTATAEECERMGRVWELSGGGGVDGGAGAAGDSAAASRPWKLKGQTWAEVIQHGFLGVAGLKVGRTLRRSTLEGPGAPPAPPPSSTAADHKRVRLLGFDAGEYTESAWAWP